MQVYCRECKAAAKEVGKERQEKRTERGSGKRVRPAMGSYKGMARYIGALCDAKLDPQFRLVVHGRYQWTSGTQDVKIRSAQGRGSASSGFDLSGPSQHTRVTERPPDAGESSDCE